MKIYYALNQKTLVLWRGRQGIFFDNIEGLKQSIYSSMSSSNFIKNKKKNSNLDDWMLLEVEISDTKAKVIPFSYTQKAKDNFKKRIETIY